MKAKIVQVATWIPRKFWKYTKSINSALEAGTTIKDSATKGFEYTTKITGATTGSSGLAKGTVDVAEAIACQDGICAFISTVGCAADALQIAASFAPGPNVTALVTTPVSWGCKVFVWCCKRSKLPFGSC